MIVYLDQNKWIELGRIIYGKNSSPGASAFADRLRDAVGKDLILPLSAIHYLEFSSISNAGRRQRLGKVMWEFSRGQTMASYKEVVQRELEIGLSSIFSSIKPRELKLIGRGVAHAFGENFTNFIPKEFDEIFERTIFTGSNFLGVEPIKHPRTGHRDVFLSHLNSLQEKKEQLENNALEDWLHAISMVDILQPLNDILQLHKISLIDFEKLEKKEYKKILAEMPTRKLDIHLHRQILKNTEYKAKPSDLEDWAGVGVASCYCDVVICEKHFADMLQRDKYSTYARIETDLYNIFLE